MVAPEFADKLIQAPLPNMSGEENYRWLYDLWQRTGGFTTYIVNLKGLQASVAELNTLVGINTNFTVQAQLNTKVDTDDIGTMAAQNSNAVSITGGTIVGITLEDSQVDLSDGVLTLFTITNSIVDGDLRIKVGDSTTNARCGASLHTDVASVSNTDNTENNLMTYTLPAKSLNGTGDYLEIKVWGSFASNANNKRIRLYFGATAVFDTGSVAANGGTWVVQALVARETLTSEKSIATLISSNGSISPTSQTATPAENNDNTILIKTTALAVAAGDVTQEGFVVKWFAAA